MATAKRGKATKRAKAGDPARGAAPPAGPAQPILNPRTSKVPGQDSEY